jgi:hypothetical protein
MGQVLFGRTQFAIQTPFEPLRNPGYGGVPSPITSTETQSAIEEALTRAIANDAFLIFASYNGNANSGRNLEVFPGIDMSIAPIFLDANTNVTSIVAATTAANATCTIGFYNNTPAIPVLLYTVTFTAVKRVTLTGLPIFQIPSNAQLAIKIDSGSINRPHLYFELNNAG